MEKLKKSIKKLIDKNNPLDEKIKVYKKKFKKLLLLPLVGEQNISLFQDCTYTSEKELLENVMLQMPTDIGVFVTQSDIYGSLTNDDIEYFRKKYPNFIFLQETNGKGYANNSLYYFKHIDAILNITSKTGFMAMIWDIPVISLAKTYNKWYQDGQDMQDLPVLLSRRTRNKNNLLYWYFTRYVLFEQDFSKKDFLYNFLSDKLNLFRKEGITFNFYNEICSIKQVSTLICSSIKIKSFKTFVKNNPLITFYKTPKGTNIKLFGFIKTKIWPK